MGEWEDRVSQSRERRERLSSFGPYARGILVSTNQGLFVVDPEDGGVSTALLQHGSYGESEFRFAEALISEESKILVVGTHLGSLALPLAKRCRLMVGIEANPRTFELLQANARLNDIQNVEIHNFAAGDRDNDHVEFLLNRDNSGGSKIKPTVDAVDFIYDDPDIIRVKTARIDTIANNRAFDLIIMDIEGSEVFALRGMPETLARSRALAVEFRPFHIETVAGATIDDFIRAVVPHFLWMFTPDRREWISHSDMAAKLSTMYSENECHDALYFFKDRPENY